MTYQVIWSPVAESRLADIWMKAADRTEVTRVAAEIDRSLRSGPADCGESRTGGRRIIVAAPLAAIFRVSEPDRRVVVITVWSFSKRPGKA